MAYCFFSMVLMFSLFQDSQMLPGDIFKVYDGNGNEYILTSGKESTIEYNPVKPENSSTGIYSGGEYVKKTITKEQYSELVKLFEQIINNKKNRIKDRVKGSYLVVFQRDGKDSRYLVSQDFKDVKSLADSLKRLIQ